MLETCHGQTIYAHSYQLLHPNLVREKRLELLILSALASKTSVYTIPPLPQNLARHGRVELPSSDRQSEIMTVIWMPLNLVENTGIEPVVTEVGGFTVPCHTIAADSPKYEWAFHPMGSRRAVSSSLSHCSSLVTHSGVEPLYPGWKPGILTDRWMRQNSYIESHSL